FGLLHERELMLSENGDVLSGRDRFMTANGGPIPDDGRDLAAIRFHLHPDITLFQDEHDRLVLTAENADRWTFISQEVEPRVEESIYFAGLSGPRRTRQIVLPFKASELPEVHWQLTRTRHPDEA